MDEGVESVSDQPTLERIRQQATRVHRRAALSASIVTAVVLAIP